MLPRLLLLATTSAASRSSTPSASWQTRLLPSRAAALGGTTASFAAKTTTTAPKTATPDADLNRGATADLLDIFHPQSVDDASTPRTVQIAEPIFRDFGGKLRFSGRAATIRCFENNPLVRAALEEEGRGRVLVVDGGGSKRCALLGDNIASLGARNGWSGVVIHGCVRDTADLATFDIGVKALAAFPLKSSKRDPGQRDVPVSFAGVTVRPNDWVYADGDGIIVSETELKLESKV
jgi:RraA family protein